MLKESLLILFFETPLNKSHVPNILDIIVTDELEEDTGCPASVIRLEVHHFSVPTFKLYTCSLMHGDALDFNVERAQHLSACFWPPYPSIRTRVHRSAEGLGKATIEENFDSLRSGTVSGNLDDETSALLHRQFRVGGRTIVRLLISMGRNASTSQ